MKNPENNTDDVNVEEMGDEELFDSYRHGDDYALTKLFGRYRRPLFVYLYRYMGNAELAEEAMQTAFLNASRNADSFDGKRKFSAWLYGIATNAAIDMQRKERRHANLLSLDASVNEEGTTHKDILVSHMPSPNDMLISTEEKMAIADGVESLAEPQRDVVKLIYFQGMKYREAAAKLDIPLGTVKSRLAQAIKDLREWYEKIFGTLQPVRVASDGGRSRR